MPFRGPVIIEKVIGGDTWIVHEDITYDAGGYGIFVVPSGFITDLASIPHALPLFLATNTEAAAIVHDWLYVTGKTSKKVADHVIYLALIESGVDEERAQTIHAAVVIGGIGPWKKHRRKDNG